MAKIMIIEDNDVHNRLLCDNVEDLGHEAMTFFDVEPAKAMLKELGQNVPELFIIDMQIKQSMKSSLDFIKFLSKSRHYKEIPVIIISAFMTKDNIKDELPGFNLDNVIEKPFNVETMTSKIKALLKGKK